MKCGQAAVAEHWFRVIKGLEAGKEEMKPLSVSCVPLSLGES